MRRHLETAHGCRVSGISHSLSDRAALEAELGEILRGVDVLLCELKAASVDVATRRAVESGVDVVYMDNVPVGVGSDDPAAAVRRTSDLAVSRHEEGRA
jgi:cyclic 2,3-diphosphoglycerate synthase